MKTQSKDLYLKSFLAEKGIFNYTQEQFKEFKKEFLENLWIYKDKEKAAEKAFKSIFGGEK